MVVEVSKREAGFVYVLESRYHQPKFAWFQAAIVPMPNTQHPMVVSHFLVYNQMEYQGYDPYMQHVPDGIPQLSIHSYTNTLEEPPKLCSDDVFVKLLVA